MSTPQQRTERLSLLKEVTGIEDNDVASYLLNKNAWDLQLAVQEYLSGGSGTHAPSSLPPSSSSSSSGHVRRRSTSPGSERRIRARQQQLMQQQREGGGGGGGGELDDSMTMGGEEDDAPLLGRGGSATGGGGGGGGAAAMEVEGGGGGGGASSLVALPFHLAGSVLRTLLAPVRYITGSGGGGEGGIQDPKRAAELFIESYEKQYQCGTNEGGGGGGARPRPRFLPLSFQEATRLAAREHKFLVVYLHAPLHEHTPSFLSQTLNTDTLTSFLDDNLLVWGGSIHSADAYHTSQLLDASAFPFLALLACHNPPHLTVLEHMEGLGRGGGEGGREGGLGVEGVLQRLTAAMARQQESLARQEAAVRERAERMRLQEEQNREYQEALEADRRREADLAAERERAREEEERERRRVGEEKEEEERKRREAVEVILMKKARLPAEPPVGEKGALRLRLQFPHGKKMDRRFNGSDTMQVVRDFIDVSVAAAEEEEGWREGGRKLVNYSLSTPYPKRTFGEEEVGMTLAETGLHSADTIYIQDLDA